MVIDVENDGILMMQGTNLIEKVKFPMEALTAFRKTKRRIICIKNCSFNGRNFMVKKLVSLKVLKIKTDDWWRVGPMFGVEVCPRLSVPAQFHPRWPCSKDNEGRAAFTKAHASLKMFMERLSFHNTHGYSKDGFTMLDRIIITKKMSPDRIDARRINSNPMLTPPQLRSPVQCPLPPKKQRIIGMVKPTQLKSKRNLNLPETEVIDLSVESSEEESEEEATAEDFAFLDNGSQERDGEQMGARVQYTKNEIKAFHEELIELIGQYANKEPFHIKTKELSTAQFCRILKSATGCDRIDLMMLVRSIPTNSFNMSEERATRLFGALLQAEFNFEKI